ncbi:MAG: P-loop NTPase fold protein [Suipraeoptans sp.]
MVIFIDDIDRLNKIEIRQIFQAVIALGDFPNTIYVLLFDKEIVSQALSDFQVGRGEEYLEKIIQIPIAMPETNVFHLRQVFVDKLNEVIKNHPYHRFNQVYFQDILEQCAYSYLSTIRDVNRVINAFTFKYGLIKEEVNVADLLAITFIEIYLPGIFQWIKDNKYWLSGGLSLDALRRNRKGTQKDELINELSPHIGLHSMDTVLGTIGAIFPKIGKQYSKQRLMQTIFLF